MVRPASSPGALIELEQDPALAALVRNWDFSPELKTELIKDIKWDKTSSTKIRGKIEHQQQHLQHLESFHLVSPLL
ncbi:uncharacterized protein [Miscanthus floridulus]|uniref:uncharacterized protein isoform X2 n=1 Tax=Miscanthus floridulus TaxID=154761 RepID=UPI00345B099C